MPHINDELVTLVRNLIRPHTRNEHDADDILQNVLLKILHHGDKIAPAAFLTWVQRVCHTTSIDFYRANGKLIADANINTLIDANAEENSASHEKELAQTQLARCIKPLLKNLPASDAALLTAVELEGTPQHQLANQLGMNYPSLKSKIQRARKKLKSQILTCCKIAIDRRQAPYDFTPQQADCCTNDNSQAC